MAKTCKPRKPRRPSKKAVARAEAVEEQLRQSIMEVDPGMRLPAIRTLKQDFAVSQETVERVIAKLEDLGLVFRKPRSGVYRTRPRPRLAHVICFHKVRLTGSPHQFYNDFVTRIIVMLSQRGIAAIFHQVPGDADLVQFLLNRGLDSTQAVITFGIQWKHLEAIRFFEQQDLNVIHVIPNYAEPLSPAVTIDDEAMVRCQVEHLVGKGHTRIAYLTRSRDDIWHRAASRRLQAFHKLALEYRLAITGDYIKHIGADHEPRRLETAIGELLKLEPRPTAIILPGDLLVKRVYAALRENGCEPGVDISVLGMNDRSFDDFTTPPLTSVGVDLTGAAEHIADIIQGAEVGAGDIHVLEPTLVERKSVVAS